MVDVLILFFPRLGKASTFERVSGFTLIIRTMPGQLTITPMQPFGARIEGKRLPDLTDAEFVRVKDAFHEHGMLVFPGAHLTPQEQADFGKRFGKMEFPQGCVPITNKRPGGGVVTPEEDQTLSACSNNRNDSASTFSGGSPFPLLFSSCWE